MSKSTIDLWYMFSTSFECEIIIFYLDPVLIIFVVVNLTHSFHGLICLLTTSWEYPCAMKADKTIYIQSLYFISLLFLVHFELTLRWPLHLRHNGRDSVSNHQPHNCLLNRLFRRRSKKTSKLRVTGLCVGNSPGTGEFPAQMASYAENVSIWWRHNVLSNLHVLAHLRVKLKYSGRINANNTAVDAWFFASLGHQQSWYWP